MKVAAAVLVALAVLAGSAQAGVMVDVTVTGEVEFNFSASEFSFLKRDPHAPV